jgi:hypothetical protein
MSRARIIADLSGGFGIDSGALSFGTDKEITLTHDPDDGLILKHAATADDSFPELTLQTGDTDIAINDILGRINFQAPDEGAGTDAILVAGAIAAISEGDFSSSSNATSLIFQTGASETATTKMTLSSGGNLTVTGNVSVGGDLDVTGDFDMSDANLTNVGSISLDSITGDADANTSITFSGSDVITFATGGATAATLNASQVLTLSGNLIIPNAGTIGSASDTDALSISSGGVVNFTARPTFAASLTIQDGGSIGSASDLNAVTISNAGVVAVTATTGSTGATSGALTVAGGAGIAADLSVGDDLFFVSDAAIIKFGVDSDINLTHVADTGLTLDGTFTAVGITSSSTLQGTTVTATTAFVPDASDGAALGTSSLEFSDLFLADAAVISLGDDDDVTITHVADTGVLINGASVVQFRDSAINIGSPADGDLDINADDEIELNSTLIDINGNVEISGTTAQVGVSTSTAKDIFNAGMSTKNGATSAGFVEFFEDSDNGTNKVTVIGPASTADVTLTLPNSAGTIATTATAADEATALAIALG